ncbi:MAG: hypothetical protein NC347_15645 [Clostridium sp.]|nr:hypothetical protein [Clostridium sp.]
MGEKNRDADRKVTDMDKTAANDSVGVHGRIDGILVSAFAIKEKPSAGLNQTIIERVKGDSDMRKPFFKTVPVVAALAAGILVTGSITTYAAWKLNAGQVVEKTDDKKLTDAFQGQDAIDISQSQTCGDYQITLMGVVSGKNISDYGLTYNDELRDDRSYAVISIGKVDGSAMPELENATGSFLVSPYIKGENPVHCNLYYMGGAATPMVEDGIMYYMVECDNLEAFAKRGVYLGVSSGTFYDRDAYNFDKTTGEISRNEKYGKVNALFELPLDKAKADEDAAEELLAKWKEAAEEDDKSVGVEKSGAVSGEENAEISKFVIIGDDEGNDEELPDVDLKSEMKKWDIKKIKEKGELIKGSAKKLHPDINGNAEYKYRDGEMVFNVKEYFHTKEERKYGVSPSAVLNKDGYIHCYVFESGRDGEVTGCVYRVKPGK